MILAVIYLDRKLKGLRIAWKIISSAWPTQSARAALWVRGTQSARMRAKCVGRGSIARAAMSARDAIAWRGEWAALATHLPRTCHAMPT